MWHGLCLAFPYNTLSSQCRLLYSLSEGLRDWWKVAATQEFPTPNPQTQRTKAYLVWIGIKRWAGLGSRALPENSHLWSNLFALQRAKQLPHTQRELQKTSLREKTHPARKRINWILLFIFLLFCLFLTHYYFFILLLIFFLVVLEFEVKASHFLGKHSTTWATPPAQFF
jgi:hypothetical protein